jgi:Fur family transcriptional regulator, ferric uptake regulator
VTLGSPPRAAPRPRIAGVNATEPRPSWAQQASLALAGAGYRRGGARSAIVELLAEQSCALSAAEIEQELGRRERAVSRASVYRVIEQLEAIGMLQRVEVGQGSVRFEPVRHGAGHHHHLVCDACGRLEPFSDDALERAIRRLSDRVPLRVSEHEIVIRGCCRSCTVG